MQTFVSSFRLSIIAIIFTLTIGCTSKADVPAAIYPLEGMEIPVYYTAPAPMCEGYNGELAVIMIQGWHGGVQVLEEQLALQEALGEAYVLSPMYPRTEMMERYNIAADGRAIWNESWPLDLTVPGTPDDDWRGGGDAAGTELSSFDVIDTLFTRLSNRKLFPNLKNIALVGFSAGGQFVGRYVAVGKGKVGDGIKVEYAAMAPSTFLRLEPADTWHYGLANRPRYCRDMSEEQILANLRSRRCFYGCGELDTLEENLDRTATAMKQGTNRLVRFENFRRAVNEDSEWSASVVFHTFSNIGHEAIKAYADPVFVKYVVEEKPIGDNAQEEQPQELVEASEPITIEEQQQEPVVTPAPTPNPKGRFIYANAYDGFVNVRAQPSAKSAKLGKLKNGPNYLVKLGVEGNWTKVKWQNGVGYVNSSLVGDTPWKPVTLNVDANWIEAQYVFNHRDLLIFSNGRYISFWNCTPFEYGVWRFEGNEIVLTTKILTALEEWDYLGECVGNESRMEVDEQNSKLGCMYKCPLDSLESRQELIATFGENYSEGDETILLSKEDFLEFKRKAAKLVRLK